MKDEAAMKYIVEIRDYEYRSDSRGTVVVALLEDEQR